MVLLSGLALMGLSLRHHNLATASCRRAVWLAQVDMSKALTQLLKLNPEARRLRLQRKIAEAELNAARTLLQVELIPALEAQRAFIIAQQLRLRQQQKFLLLQAGYKRAAAKQNFLHLRNAMPMQQVVSRSLTPDLAVNFVPPFDLSPDAVLKTNFSQAQKLTLRWQTQFLAQAPWELMQILNIKPQTFYGRCAATLEQEGTKWRPQLVADKF